MSEPQHRRLVHRVFLVFFLSGALGACSAPIASMDPQYAGSSCATCVASACPDVIAKCQNDTRCAVYLECLGQCAPASSGDADPDCDLGCRALVPAASQNTLAQVTSCRENGLGSICQSCGRAPIVGSALHQILNQRCVGVQPPAVATDDRSSCLIPPAPDRLNRCAETYCCQGWASCQGNPDCKALIQCMHQCTPGDAFCTSHCEAKYQKGAIDFQQLALCTGYYCQPCLPKPIVDLCSICLVTRCIDAWYQCNTNLDCINLTNCRTDCTYGPSADNEACQLDCYYTYPDEAQRQHTGLVACWHALCPLECQNGQ